MYFTPEESHEARVAVLTGGVLKLKQAKFAGKQSSNNKLDMEELEHQPKRRAKIIGPMQRIIRDFAPDLLVGVPQTGQDWALEIGHTVNIPVAELEKVDPELNTFTYASEIAYLLVAKAIKIVMVEDTTTRRTNENGVYTCCPEIAEKTLFCVTGWARGSTAERIAIPGIPLVPVVEEYIPYDLNGFHPLYEFAVQDQPERA